MLGKTSLPNQKPRSVFDYLSEKDRARLQNLTGKSSNEPSVTVEPCPNQSRNSRVDPAIAQAAFNEEKQSRYMTYLHSQIGSSTSSEDVAVPLC